jgi:ABC-type transport system involved in multi-copper enzyme maturation permease subunit
LDRREDVKNSRDELIKDYNAILRESTLLTTVSGFIFGFLFNTTINTPKNFTPVDSIILTIALFTSTCSICLFVMPVVYHNIQYPYSNLEKFKKRSHNFVLFGLIPAGITLYLGLLLGLRLGVKLGVPTVTGLDYVSILLAFVPFGIAYIAFKERKRQLLE